MKQFSGGQCNIGGCTQLKGNFHYPNFVVFSPNLLVKEYSICIVNGIRFHIRDLNNRCISQSSSAYVEGDHEEQIHDFYSHLLSI